MTLTPKHRDKIQAAGKNLALIEQQIQHFISDFPPMNILKPARIGKGIFKTTEAGEETLISYYDSQSKSKDIVKFVPASGAASRMFKDLFAFLEEENATLDKHPAVSKIHTADQKLRFLRSIRPSLESKRNEPSSGPRAKELQRHLISASATGWFKLWRTPKSTFGLSSTRIGCLYAYS